MAIKQSASLNLIKELIQAKKFDNALTSVESLETNGELSIDESLIAKNLKATIFLHLLRYQEAFALTDYIIDGSSILNRPIEYLEAYITRIISLYYLNEFEKAVNVIGDVENYLSNFQFAESQDILAKSNMIAFWKCTIFYAQGLYDKASIIVQNAMKLQESAINHPLIMDFQFLICKIFIKQENYSKALEIAFNCLKISENEKNCPNIAFSLFLIGLSYKESGKAFQSLDYFEHSLSYDSKSHLSKYRVEILTTLAELHWSLCLWDDAISYYEETLAYSRENNDTTQISASLFILVVKLTDNGDKNRANEYFMQLDSLMNEGKNSSAKIYWQLCKAYQMKNSNRTVKQAEAQKIFSETILEKSLTVKLTLFILLNLSDLLLLELRAYSNQFVLKELEGTLSKLYSLANTYNFQQYALEANLRKTQLLLISGDLEGAQNLLKACIQVSEDRSFLNLALKATKLYDTLRKNFSTWKQLILPNMTIQDRIAYLNLEDLINKLDFISNLAEEDVMKQIEYKMDKMSVETSKKLINLKDMLHPVRLTILKLLYQHNDIPAKNLKQLLGITWGAWAHHIQSLEKKEYIVTQQKFINESPRSVIKLTSKGKEMYLEIQQLLKMTLEENLE